MMNEKMNAKNRKYGRLLILALALLLVSCVTLVACSGESKQSDKQDAVIAEENVQKDAVKDDASLETPSSDDSQKDNTDIDEGNVSEAHEEDAAVNTDVKKEEKQSEKKDSKKAEKKKDSEKKQKQTATKEKKWVEPVYKTIEHPEEGHYETVTEWYCLCGKKVDSKEGWKKHREEFIASNGGVCNGEHVRPDPKETQVWVVDKAAWTEQVLVSEGHWE